MLYNVLNVKKAFIPHSIFKDYSTYNNAGIYFVNLVSENTLIINSLIWEGFLNAPKVAVLILSPNIKLRLY